MQEVGQTEAVMCIGAGMVDPITGADLSHVSLGGMVMLVEKLIVTLEAAKQAEANGGS